MSKRMLTGKVTITKLPDNKKNIITINCLDIWKATAIAFALTDNEIFAKENPIVFIEKTILKNKLAISLSI